MNTNTLRRLEFDKIIAMLEGETVSTGGARLARALLPVSGLETVQSRIGETREILSLMNHGDTGFLSQLPDIGPSLKRAAAAGILSAGELAEVFRVARAIRLAAKYLEPGSGPAVKRLRAELHPLPDLERDLNAAIDESGDVRDTASSELKSIRTRMMTLRARIRDYLRDFVKSPQWSKYLQDGLVTERGGRYVVPVRQEYRNEIRGIVHDESASGATVFIEPEVVVRSNNEIRQLELEEKREIERILRALTAKVAVNTEELSSGGAALETLDFWVAKGRLALKLEAYEPVLNGNGIIRLFRARHPLLGKRAVPINIELGRSFDILVITGPNTGGKTVGLKTVGLLSLMAMAGLYVPASPDSELAVLDDVLVDIGDEQSIEQSLSTFSSHMTNTISILKDAGSNTLVVLDELGAGTDPLEGAALARAILERLLESGARVVVSTHHSELKAFAYANARVENASVEFDPVSLRPTYRLTIGLPGMSNALEIASNLGLDQKMVERARHYVPQQEVEVGRMIAELRALRFELEQEREGVRRQRADLLAEQAKMAEARRHVEEAQEKAMKQLRQDVSKYVDEVRRDAEEIIDEMKERAREADAPKWHEIAEMRKKVSEAIPAPKIKASAAEADSAQRTRKIGPGTYVELTTIGQKGYVLEGPGASGDLTVQVGIMKFNTKLKDVKALSSPEEKETHQRTRTFLDKRQDVPSEIMVRGLQADEAMAEVEKYIEDAFLAGIEVIRIIHGKGAGILRTSVRGFLAKHPYVEKYREGETGEGGHGVTVAYLKVH
ncbi:MAG: endonuclease MutS2 [Solirubrobacterales bacterium]